MIVILTKDDFWDYYDLINKTLDEKVLNYTKHSLNDLGVEDVIIFKYKDSQIILKSAHETYEEAFERNVVNEEWLERLK